MNAGLKVGDQKKAQDPEQFDSRILLPLCFGVLHNFTGTGPTLPSTRQPE